MLKLPDMLKFQIEPLADYGRYDHFASGESCPPLIQLVLTARLNLKGHTSKHWDNGCRKSCSRVLIQRSGMQDISHPLFVNVHSNGRQAVNYSGAPGR